MTGFAEAIDYSPGKTGVMSIGNPGRQESKEESQYTDVIGVFQRMGRLGRIKQAALITRDGLLIKDMPENTYTGIFASMIAASFGVAETVFAEIQRGKTDTLVLCMKGERIIVVGAGSKMLLTAIIEDKVNDVFALRIIENAAETIKLMS